MAKYKIGQRLYLNHSAHQIIHTQHSRSKGLLNYCFVITDILDGAYKVSVPNDDYQYHSIEPFGFVENEKHYSTKPSMAHILYA